MSMPCWSAYWWLPFAAAAIYGVLERDDKQKSMKFGLVIFAVLLTLADLVVWAGPRL
jgi:hypothetical protein